MMKVRQVCTEICGGAGRPIWYIWIHSVAVPHFVMLTFVVQDEYKGQLVLNRTLLVSAVIIAKHKRLQHQAQSWTTT
jgi:hypothetical protein